MNELRSWRKFSEETQKGTTFLDPLKLATSISELTSADPEKYIEWRNDFVSTLASAKQAPCFLRLKGKFSTGYAIIQAGAADNEAKLGFAMSWNQDLIHAISRRFKGTPRNWYDLESARRLEADEYWNCVYRSIQKDDPNPPAGLCLPNYSCRHDY